MTGKPKEGAAVDLKKSRAKQDANHGAGLSRAGGIDGVSAAILATKN